MIAVRHRTASGPSGSAWEFDVERRVVDVVLCLGSAAPVAFTVAVCAPDRAREGAHPVMRLDGESWRILPARFRFEHGILVPIDAAIHVALGPGKQIVLTTSPADVDEEIASL
jgi:hypothetical protein